MSRLRRIAKILGAIVRPESGAAGEATGDTEPHRLRERAEFYGAKCNHPARVTQHALCFGPPCGPECTFYAGEL